MRFIMIGIGIPVFSKADPNHSELAQPFGIRSGLRTLLALIGIGI